MKDYQKQNSESAENIQALQHKKLQEIGAKLSSIRTKKGIELDSIVAKTQITKRVLIAIEKGNLSELPEPFYTKALIKKYAQVLGMTNVPDYMIVVEQAKNNAKSGKKLNLSKYLPRWQFPKLKLRSQHLYLLYLILVGIAVKGIATVVDKPSQTGEPILFTETDISQTNSSGVPNSPTKNSNPTSQLIAQSNNKISDSVVVDVSVKERCWLKVVVDEKVEFEGILQQGINRSWTGKEKITIVAGNAGGVVVTYNKGQGKILGKPGEVEEVTYTLN